MFDEIREFRNKLKSGRPCLGVSVTFADPAVSEAIGPSTDFLWIDLEHSPTSFESLQAHLIAARAARVAALVRVPGSDVPTIKRVLDIGAPGLIVPQVSSAAEVQGIVDACRYKPLGNRGFGPRRPSNFGRAGAGFLAESNRDLFVSVQIENTAALAEVEAIAAVPHLDSLVLGPYDLSLSMGRDVNHPDVTAAIERIIAAANKNGLAVGSGMNHDDEAFAARAIKLGVNWLQVGCDFGYLIQGVDQVLARIRAGNP